MRAISRGHRPHGGLQQWASVVNSASRQFYSVSADFGHANVELEQLDRIDVDRPAHLAGRWFRLKGRSQLPQNNVQRASIRRLQ